MSGSNPWDHLDDYDEECYQLELKYQELKLQNDLNKQLNEHLEQKNKRLRKELEECEVIEAREREETKKMETLNKDMKANRLKMNKAIVKLKIENIYAHYTEQGEQNNDLLAKQSADETAAFIQEKMNTLADLENSEQMKSLREDERTLQKANEELDKTNAEVKKLEEQIALLQIDNQRKETTLIVEMVAASMKLNATREEYEAVGIKLAAMSREVRDMQAAKELNGNVMTPEKFLSQPSESNVRTPSLDKIDFELPTFDNPFKNPNHIPNLTGGIRKIVQLPPKIVGSLLKTNTNSVGENIVIEIFDDDEKNESEKVVSVTPKCLSNLKKIRKQKKASAPAALLSVIKKGNTIDGLLKLPIIATTCTQAPDKIPVKNPSTRSPAKIPSTMSPVKIPLTKNPVVIKAQTPKKPVVKAQTPLSRQLRDRKTDNLVQNLLKDPMSRRLSKREPSSTVLKPQPEVKKSKKDAEKDIKKTVASPIIPAPPVTIPEDGLQLSQPSPNKTKGLEKKSVAGYSSSDDETLFGKEYQMDLPDLNQSRLSNSEDEGNFDFLDGSGKGFSDKNEDASATVDFFAAPTTSKKNEEEHFSLF